MSGECPKCLNDALECTCMELHPFIKELTKQYSVQFSDQVNHPHHYQGNSIEVIDIIEDFGLNFHLGNALKYILRSSKKEDKQQDLKKAIWYLERELTNE